jgi:hypothetical protein
VSSWNKSQEVCAACRYWAGQREVDFTGYHFLALEPTGKCQKPFGPYRSFEMGEGSHCSEWDSFDDDDH